MLNDILYFAVLLYTEEMAESDIASEYGVPQFECNVVKQQKKEHEETDDGASIKVSTEGIVNGN